MRTKDPTPRSGWTATVMILACVAANAADWPRWRGPDADGISRETGLLKEWPEDGPKVAWQVETVGEGYSTVSVVGDRVYTQGNVDGIENTIALSAADGSVVWAVQPEPLQAAAKARVEDALKRGDKNGDGKLEECEALAILGWDVNKAEKPIPGDAREIAAQRAARLLAGLDKDGDQVLIRTEAGRGLGSAFSGIDLKDKDADVAALAKQRTDALFSAIDKDGDGTLVREEYQGTWLQRGVWRIDSRVQGSRRGDGKLTRDEVDGYLRKREPGKDGKLTEEELRSHYVKAFPNRDGIYTAEELGAQFGGYRHSVGNGPRGAPTVDGDRLYVEGGSGDVCCLEAATGKTVWHVSLTKDFGGGIPGWGYSESPLVVDDMLLVTPGGQGGMVVALNKATGELIWRSDEITGPAEYSTPVLAVVGGIRQIVQFGKENVFGLTTDKGRLMWTYRHQKAPRTINITTPIISDDHVLASSAYGNGTGLGKITTAEGKQSTQEVYFEKRLANHHGGIIKVGDHFYGTSDRGLVCMNFLTGEIAWQDGSVGKGSLTVADGMLYLLSEKYVVGLAEATPEGYREHGRFKIKNLGKPSWAHPVVANGRLYIRNQHILTAYDVKAN